MKIIEMTGITKRFGELLANDQVCFSVQKGEIHALLGENGAGKTTLMRILFGLIQPDAGLIEIGGERVSPTPAQAMDLGIAMVHQHFMLFEPMTVAENVVMGCEPGKVAFSKREAENLVSDLCRQYNFQLDPAEEVENLPLGQRQKVEILKALYRGAEVLILDEPTAVLTPPEVAELFAILRGLRKAGKTIVIITHKLRETMELADRVTVLRQGRTAGVVTTSHTCPEELARLMVGRDVDLNLTVKRRQPGPVALQLEGIHLTAPRRQKLQDINLDVRHGEILGIAGVDGNGQRELLEVIAGLSSPSQGQLLLKGNEINDLPPRQRFQAGMGYVPEDRLTNGLINHFSVADNVILGYHRQPRFGRRLLDFAAINSYAQELIKRFDIRGARPTTPAGRLSGGNQQKVLLARVLAQNPEVIVVAHPTRGVDVGAIEAIHRQLIELRSEGKAILLVSADLDEIRKLSDRIAVIFEGTIADCRPKEYWSESELGLAMAGKQFTPLKGAVVA